MRWVEYIFPANARKSPLVESQSVVLPVYHHFLAFTIIVPTLSQQISTFVHEDKNKNIMLLSYIWYFIASLWRCFYHNWYSNCNLTTKYDLGYHLQFLWFFILWTEFFNFGSILQRGDLVFPPCREPTPSNDMNTRWGRLKWHATEFR